MTLAGFLAAGSVVACVVSWPAVLAANSGGVPRLAIAGASATLLGLAVGLRKIRPRLEGELGKLAGLSSTVAVLAAGAFGRGMLLVAWPWLHSFVFVVWAAVMVALGRALWRWGGVLWAARRVAGSSGAAVLLCGAALALSALNPDNPPAWLWIVVCGGPLAALGAVAAECRRAAAAG